MTFTLRNRTCTSLALTLSLLSPIASLAAPPVVRVVTPRGLTIGGATTLHVVGANLQANPRLVSRSLPGMTQTVETYDASQCKIAITLPAGASAGIHALRLATDDGISDLFLVGADALPQQILRTDAVVTPPVAISGSVTGGAVLRSMFTGKQGQRVVIDVESQRLGAKLNPVVRLLDERGTQIAWSGGMSAIGGDARCTAILPSDGRYTIVLHDKLYRGAGPGHLRLKVGDLHYADFAMPLGVTRGGPARVQLIGDAQVSQELIVAADDPPTSHIAAPLRAGATGSAPSLFVSSHPELVEGEVEEGKSQSLPAAPVAVSGCLQRGGEVDRYTLPATPGAKLRIELHAMRIGAPIDGVIDVLRANGQRLGGNDDQATTSDPGLDFTVPSGVSELTIAVRDMLKLGGSTSLYRLSVRPLGAPNFSLAIEQPTLIAPSDSPSVVKVSALREGYDGPIKLITHGLPSGFSVSGAEIPAGSDFALLTIVASDVRSTGVCLIEGQSVGIEPVIRRTARRPENELIGRYPHLAEELGWAVVRPSPIRLAWTPASDDALQLGGKLAAPLTLTRAEGVNGDVRLSLLTNQTIPTKKVKNPKTKKDELVSDTARALRLEGTPLIAANSGEATVQILVPGDLPTREWDIVIRGELLSADKKTVVATTYTSLNRLGTLGPLRLELSTTGAVQARAGLGETGVIKGAVYRAEGFNHPVRIALSDLPEGYEASEVTLPPEKSDFEFAVRFAYGTTVGELKNARVVATSQTDPKNASLLVRSNAVPVAINVIAGEKPAAQQPHVVFEDDPKFVELLNQGGGKISLESDDKQSGAASVKVTPDQRYAPSLAALGKKIRENPNGPNEFRYLRFAWKKQGGKSICLQINHDGAWGVGGTGKQGAKFRYHAGPGGECYTASVILGEKLPIDWVVVTRDLFADFGEFTFNGIALSPVDGEFALYDSIYLGKSSADFELIKP